MRAAVLAVATLLDCACGSSHDTAQIGMQRWGGFDVSVELRPAPPREGHNEVVVIVSGEHHKPVYDALVALRADPRREWVQAIQDGHIGVYRRAVYFGPGPSATLQVRLQRGDAQEVLEFPVGLTGAN